MATELTDFEKMKNLLTEFGVGFEERGRALKCEEGMKKVEGYFGSSAWFEFDEAGTFQRISVGEG